MPKNEDLEVFAEVADSHGLNIERNPDGTIKVTDKHNGQTFKVDPSVIEIDPVQDAPRSKN